MTYSLSYTSLPTGVTAVEAPMQVLNDDVDGALTKLQVNAASDTLAGTYDVTVTGTIVGFEADATATITLTVTIIDGCQLPLSSTIDPT